jgi:hypothetical protein
MDEGAHLYAHWMLPVTASTPTSYDETHPAPTSLTLLAAPRPHPPSQDASTDVEGKLSCPKCGARVGTLNWTGSQCSCAFWPPIHERCAAARA